MTLQALLRSAVLSSASIKFVFALCGAALALTAALAVTCFVKTYAMSFFGIRRSSWEPQLRAQAGSHFPLVFLAVVCLLLGICRPYIIPVLNRAVEPLESQRNLFTDTSFFTANSSNQELPPAFLQDFHNLGAQSGRKVLPGRGLVILARFYRKPAGLCHVAVLQFRLHSPSCCSWLGLYSRVGHDNGRRSAASSGPVESPGSSRTAAHTATGFSESRARCLPGCFSTQHYRGPPADRGSPFPHRDSPATRRNPHGGSIVPPAGERGSLHRQSTFSRLAYITGPLER